MTGIEFNMPARNSKFAVKDVSPADHYCYEIYAADDIIIRGGKAEIKTQINYKFDNRYPADVFSAVVKSSCVDYELRPEAPKLTPTNNGFKTLSVWVYSLTKNEIKLPHGQPIAKIVMY